MDRRSVVVALAAFPISACGLRPDYKIRYRLGVTLSDDGRTHEGSSVIETRLFMNGALARLDGAVFHTQVEGDAVAFGLGARGNLFCLLGPAMGQTGFPVAAPQQILFKYLPRDIAFNPDYNVAFSALSNLRGEYPVPEKFWPVLLSLRDPGNFETVKWLAQDSDVRITSVTMTITDAPVTRGLAEELPWWKGADQKIARSGLDLRPDNFVQG